MDEPMDVDDHVNVPFATKPRQLPQQHLEDFQSNKENAVNPNISYEDLDVSEMNMRLRMSMSCTPMASPATKVDSRRNIGLSSSVMNEQLNYLNARYVDVANASVSNESFDVSVSDMSVDDADSTLVLVSATETVENTNKNNTIHLQKDNHIETETPQPSVQTKEPLKIMSDEANRNNASLHANTGNKNIPGTNMNESSPIIRGLRSVINMFRPSQSPIPLSPSPLVDDNTVCLSDSSNASPITPHAITISDDDELEIQQESITDKSHILSPSYPQICHVKKQYKKEDVGNKSSTSEEVVFKEEFINDLQWNDDSTIIFNTRKSTQNVRFSSSSSESPCDLDTASGPQSFTNLSGEFAGEGIPKAKSSSYTEKHSILEESSCNSMQNVEQKCDDFPKESVEPKENIFAASRLSVDQETSLGMSVTELIDSKSSNDTTSTQNTTILVKPNTTVNLGNDKTIEESCSMQNTTIELESRNNIAQNVTALTSDVNIEENNEIILNNDGNQNITKLDTTYEDSKSFVVHTENEESKPLDNSNQNTVDNSITQTNNFELNTNEEVINKSFDVHNTAVNPEQLNNISAMTKINGNIENCEREQVEDIVETITNELHSNSPVSTVTKIEICNIEHTMPQNMIPTVKLTGNDENNVPMDLNIPEHNIPEVSVEDSKDTKSLVPEFDELKMTSNQQNLPVKNSQDLLSEINCADICDSISNDEKSIVKDIETNFHNSTFKVEQCDFTDQTKHRALDENVEAESSLKLQNDSQNLDQSIYESANIEHQESIVDFKETSITDNNITLLRESDSYVSAESNKCHKVSEKKADNVLQESCPIRTEIKTSEKVEISGSSTTGCISMFTSSNQEQQVDTQIFEGPVSVEMHKTSQKSKENEKGSTGIDFDNVENAFETITRIGTSPEKVSPNKTIEPNVVQTVRSDSAIIIQNASLNISEDIVQELHSSLHTSDKTLLQAENVLNHLVPTQDTRQSTVIQDVLPSTVDEQNTSNKIVDTTENYIDDIENPFVTKTRIRESFSPSKECTGNQQLGSIDNTCKDTSKTEVYVPFNENTTEECAQFANSDWTNVGESASPSKECIDAKENQFRGTKKQFDSNPKTWESKKTNRKSRDATKTQFESVNNSFVTKVEKCNLGSPTKERTNVKDKFIDSTKYPSAQNSKIGDSVKLCQKSADPGEIQFENIENPFITKTKIRDSASPSKEYTDIGDDFVDHNRNTFSSDENRDTSEKQFENMENPFVKKTKIQNSASPSNEPANVEENSLKCSENLFVTKSKIGECPSSSYDGSDAVAKHLDIKPFVKIEMTSSDQVNSNKENQTFNYMDNSFDTKSEIQVVLSSTENYINQNTLAANPADKDTVKVDFINDPFSTIGVMQEGYFSTTDGEMMELDRSIEEEFQPGELFADLDAFDYFMSGTNKNEALEKGKESLFLKFDPLYSATTNSEGVVSSLAKLSRNRMSINQNLNNTIVIDSSDNDIRENTFVADTGVASQEMNPTISFSNSTFHPHHDPSKDEHISDVSIISHELDQTLEAKKVDLTTNSACNEGLNSSFTIQSNNQTLEQQNIVQIKTHNGSETMLVKENQLGTGCDREVPVIIQNVTGNIEEVDSTNAMADNKDDELNKTVLVSSSNHSALIPPNGLESEEMNLTITLNNSNENKKAEKIIALRSPNRTAFNKTSSYTQAADIHKQNAQNTSTVSQGSPKIDNSITMQHSFNSTFDKLTGGVTDKPTLMVSPARNSEKIYTSSRSTPLSTDRENVTTAVSPAMAVINRLIFERSTPTSNSDNTTHVNVENNTADTVLCEITSSHYEQGHEIQHNHLQQETRVMLNKIAEYELRVKNLIEENADKVEKIDHLQKKLIEKSTENKNMANVMEDYERTISQLISEREAEKSKQAEERRKLVRELDEQTAHLASMEYSFNDLHTKYERSKIIVKGYRTNEEALKKTIADNEVNFRKLEANYNLLQQHATAKLSAANEELDKIRKHHDSEILKLNALVKRKEMLASSLQESLNQEKKNNEQLTAICDELINKVG